jgi:hypothetical protein
MLVLRSQVLNSTHKGKSGRDEPDFPFFMEFVTLRSAALAALLLIVLLLILILSSRIPLGNVLLILLRLIWKLPRFLRLAGLLARILLGIVCHEKYSLRNASCGAIASLFSTPLVAGMRSSVVCGSYSARGDYL